MLYIMRLIDYIDIQAHMCTYTYMVHKRNAAACAESFIESM
jgi:hypothetical protein